MITLRLILLVVGLVAEIIILDTMESSSSSWGPRWPFSDPLVVPSAGDDTTTGQQNTFPRMSGD